MKIAHGMRLILFIFAFISLTSCNPTPKVEQEIEVNVYEVVTLNFKDIELNDTYAGDVDGTLIELRKKIPNQTNFFSTKFERRISYTEL